jgi:hypothetical protein
MKVPNKVLSICIKMANGASVTPEERATVLLWAQEGLTKRDAAKIEAAQALLAATASK